MLHSKYNRTVFIVNSVFCAVSVSLSANDETVEMNNWTIHAPKPARNEEIEEILWQRQIVWSETHWPNSICHELHMHSNSFALAVGIIFAAAQAFVYKTILFIISIGCDSINVITIFDFPPNFSWPISIIFGCVNCVVGFRLKFSRCHESCYRRSIFTTLQQVNAIAAFKLIMFAIKYDWCRYSMSISYWFQVPTLIQLPTFVTCVIALYRRIWRRTSLLCVCGGFIYSSHVINIVCFELLMLRTSKRNIALNNHICHYFAVAG